jgi:hypothetical protein
MAGGTNYPTCQVATGHHLQIDMDKLQVPIVFAGARTQIAQPDTAPVDWVSTSHLMSHTSALSIVLAMEHNVISA